MTGQSGTYTGDQRTTSPMEDELLFEPQRKSPGLGPGLFQFKLLLNLVAITEVQTEVPAAIQLDVMSRS